MTVTAGQRLIAGRIPGERIGTTTRTSSSAGITTVETVVDTITVPLVAGREYKVVWYGDIQSTVAADRAFTRIRENGLGGVPVEFARKHFPTANNYPEYLEGEYTAVATGDKTFVFTLIKEAGSGTISSPADAAGEAFLYVEYVEG